MHNADIKMRHMCACRWLYQYVIFKYPCVLVRLCEFAVTLMRAGLVLY